MRGKSFHKRESYADWIVTQSVCLIMIYMELEKNQTVVEKLHCDVSNFCSNEPAIQTQTVGFHHHHHHHRRHHHHHHFCVFNIIIIIAFIIIVTIIIIIIDLSIILVVIVVLVVFISTIIIICHYHLSATQQQKHYSYDRKAQFDFFLGLFTASPTASSISPKVAKTTDNSRAKHPTFIVLSMS